MFQYKKSFKRCYNCGCELVPEKIPTKEHIPMRTLYTGLTKTLKGNLLTVPACETCNKKYSLIDQKMRDLVAVIGLIKRRVDLKELINASARSFAFNNEFKGSFFIDLEGHINFCFTTHDFDVLHIKNFKGLFFHEFGYPLPGEYQCFVLSDHGGVQNPQNQIEKFIEIERRRSVRRVDWEKVGDLNIFKYRISINNDTSLRVLKDNDIVHCEMHYHNLIYAHVMACGETIARKLLYESI